MKRLLCVWILLFSNQMQAQTYHGWKLGLSGGPVHYWYYNKGIQLYEESYRDHGFDGPYFKGNNTKLINGFTLGFCAEKVVKRKWTFRGELSYSHQTQSYLQSNYFSPIPVLNVTISNTFNYIKLPLMFGYRIPLNKSKTLHLQLNQGLQLSFLQYYELKREGNFEWPVSITDSNGQVITVVKESHEIEKLSGLQIEQWFNYQVYGTYTKRTIPNWPYRRFVMGTITDIGVSGALPVKMGGFEHWYYAASLRFEYDFISPDANNEVNHQTDIFLGRYSSTNYKTHNIRVGLNVSLMYHFNKR